jgi:uncharacterized protein (TIGR00661 family)
MEQKSVCISPLDWGLGHATRCITLIRALESLQYKIYIATEGKHEAILREAFPNAVFLKLRGYRIWYTKKRAGLIPGILLQIPKIITAIIHEYFWLKKAAKQYHFDLVISDNRFGFFHKQIKSVFITHQLELQTPFKWSTRLNQKITYAIIKKYNACWIADMAPQHSLSGILSNPKHKPTIPIWHMNCLSRLQADPTAVNKELDKLERSLYLGIVSGPEPQRTLFENILWQQGNAMRVPFSLVAGLPDHPEYHKKSELGNLYAHLNENKLAAEIKHAKYIICRGGYTTLMELIPFKKKLIFVPTPGQTEQEYLGQYWQAKKWAISFSQSEFNLQTAIEKANEFDYQTPPFIAFNTIALENELKRLSL